MAPWLHMAGSMITPAISPLAKRASSRARSFQPITSKPAASIAYCTTLPHAERISEPPLASGVKEIGLCPGCEDQPPPRHADAEIAVDPAGDILRGVRDQRRGTVEGQ